jgi:hypothetical protein
MPRTERSLTPLDASEWSRAPALIPMPPYDLEWTPQMQARARALQHLLPWQLEKIDQWERTICCARQARESLSSRPFFVEKVAKARSPEAFWRAWVLSCGGMKID